MTKRKTEDYFKNTKIAHEWFYADPRITNHLRAIKRIQFIQKLNKGIVDEIHAIREKYKITYEWKEDIRKTFEEEISDENSFQKHYGDQGDLEDDYYLIDLYKTIRGGYDCIDGYIEKTKILKKAPSIKNKLQLLFRNPNDDHLVFVLNAEEMIKRNIRSANQ
ncbi:unnamed protein product, partial [marine sediment metagenome]